MNAIRNALSKDSDKTSSSGHSGLQGGNEGHQLPVQSGVTGRAEEDGAGGRSMGGQATGDFTDKHSIGHSHATNVANDFDPRGAQTTHDHTHLKEKLNETRFHHEVEEVERVKDHERHVHHVQHHVQPLKDTEHKAEQVHERVIPQTHIEERHVSSEKDKHNFAGLAAKVKDEVHHAPKERTVVDKGERVHETVHHHVHNVVQPVVHKDTHEHHKIHTVIPTHHVSHEAPIVHQSVEHPMLSKDDFLKQGGQLGSSTTHENADVLATGSCERTVDGVGEKLAKELNLKSGTTAGQHEADTRI